MAGEFNAGSVVAKLKLVDDGFGSKLSAAFASTSRFEKGLMAAGAAAVAVGGTIAVLTQQAADYTDKLGKMAQQIGMTTEQLSSYSLAASLSDISTEEFGKSVSLLSRKMVDAASGNEEAAKSFAQLGISVKNANGTLKRSDQVLEEIADKFAGAKDSATKTALAMDLMGRSGASMIPLLNGGAKEIANIREEASRMGLVFSQDAFKAAELFNDSQTRIGQSLIGLRQQIGQTIISLVNQTGIFEKIAEAVQAVTGWWMGLSASTRESIVITAAVTGGLVALAGAVSALTVIIPIAAKAMTAAFITNPVGLAVAAIALAVGLLVMKWKELVQWLQPVIAAFQNVWNSIKQIKDALAPLIASFGSFAKLFKGDTFKNVDFIATGLKAGLLPAAQAANMLAAAMGAVIDTIEGAVRGFRALMNMVNKIAIVLAELKHYTVDLKMELGEAMKLAFMTPDEGGMTGFENINKAWQEMGNVAGETTDKIGKRFSDMTARNAQLVRDLWTKSTTPPPSAGLGPGQKGDIAGPAGGEEKSGTAFNSTISKMMKVKAPELDMSGPMKQIEEWGGRVINLMSKLSADAAQIAQNKLTTLSNFGSLWSEVTMKNMEKAHEAEREALQAQEDAKLSILRNALDIKLSLINEEFAARKLALEAELAAQKAGIDAMTAARIAEAEAKSVDAEERTAAVATIEEDGLRLKEEADKEHQAKIDAERTKFQVKASDESKKANEEFENEKKASAKRMIDLEKKQADEKKEISKKSAAFQYALSLAGFVIGQQQAMAQARLQYAQAMMSAVTTGMQFGWGAPAAIPALMAMANMAYMSSVAAIHSTPPPLPPAELFAENGGMVPGPRHSQGGVRAELEGGEFVMPRGPAMANLGLLEAMREGRSGMNGGVTVIMHVGALDPAGRSIESVGRELGLSVRSHL